MNNLKDWMNEIEINIKSLIGWVCLSIGLMIVVIFGKQFGDERTKYEYLIKNIEITTPENVITTINLSLEYYSVYIISGLLLSLVGSVLLIGQPKKGLK